MALSVFWDVIFNIVSCLELSVTFFSFLLSLKICGTTLWAAWGHSSQWLPCYFALSRTAGPCLLFALPSSENFRVSMSPQRHRGPSVPLPGAALSGHPACCIPQTVPNLCHPCLGNSCGFNSSISFQPFLCAF